MKSVTNDPETEQVDHRAILEQFKYGLYSPRVKQFVCKRAPATLNAAVILANDCLAIDNWIQSSELISEQSKRQMEEMQREIDRLRQAPVAVHQPVPASLPAEPVMLPPMQMEVQATASSTTGSSNVVAAAVSNKRALPTQDSSTDLFDDSNDEHSESDSATPKKRTGKKRLRVRVAKLKKAATSTDETSVHSDDSSVASRW